MKLWELDENKSYTWIYAGFSGSIFCKHGEWTDLEKNKPITHRLRWSELKKIDFIESLESRMKRGFEKPKKLYAFRRRDDDTIAFYDSPKNVDELWFSRALEYDIEYPDV